MNTYSVYFSVLKKEKGRKRVQLAVSFVYVYILQVPFLMAGHCKLHFYYISLERNISTSIYRMMQENFRAALLRLKPLESSKE